MPARGGSSAKAARSPGGGPHRANPALRPTTTAAANRARAHVAAPASTRPVEPPPGDTVPAWAARLSGPEGNSWTGVAAATPAPPPQPKARDGTVIAN